jgi:hypothetical protein
MFGFVFGLFWCLFGAIFAGVGISMSKSEKRFWLDSKRAYATFDKLKFISGYDSDGGHLVAIVHLIINGVEVEGNATGVKLREAAFREGQSIAVRYVDKGETFSIRVDEDGHREQNKALRYIFTGLGITFIVAGIIVILVTIASKIIFK